MIIIILPKPICDITSLKKQPFFLHFQMNVSQLRISILGVENVVVCSQNIKHQ